MAPAARWEKGYLVISLQDYLNVPENFATMLRELSGRGYEQGELTSWEQTLERKPDSQDEEDRERHQQSVHLQRDTFGPGPRPYTDPTAKKKAIERGKERRKAYGAAMLQALERAEKEEQKAHSKPKLDIWWTCGHPRNDATVYQARNGRIRVELYSDEPAPGN